MANINNGIILVYPRSDNRGIVVYVRELETKQGDSWSWIVQYHTASMRLLLNHENIWKLHQNYFLSPQNLEFGPIPPQVLLF